MMYGETDPELVDDQFAFDGEDLPEVELPDYDPRQFDLDEDFEESDEDE